MTLSLLEFKDLESFEEVTKSLPPISSSDMKPISAQTLARRLAGIMSRESADQLEQHINESCEQVDD